MVPIPATLPVGATSAAGHGLAAVLSGGMLEHTFVVRVVTGFVLLFPPAPEHQQSGVRELDLLKQLIDGPSADRNGVTIPSGTSPFAAAAAED